MECINCGTTGDGNYCGNCGNALNLPTHTWFQEVNYKKLIAHTLVQDQISQHQARAVKAMSAESFLGLAFKLMPVDLSSGFITKGVVPLSIKLGIKTGKSDSQTFDLEPGQTIAAVLCSFAQRSFPVREVKQYGNGCQLEAKIPSNMFSWEGVLFVSIGKVDEGILVEAVTKIGGQIYDWGRSKRILRNLFADISEIAREMQG